jgi:hypothetical protein
LHDAVSPISTQPCAHVHVATGTSAPQSNLARWLASKQPSQLFPSGHGLEPEPPPIDGASTGGTEERWQAARQTMKQSAIRFMHRFNPAETILAQTFATRMTTVTCEAPSVAS